MVGKGWKLIARTVVRKVCLVCLVYLVRLLIGPKTLEGFFHCHFHILLYVRSKAIK